MQMSTCISDRMLMEVEVEVEVRCEMTSLLGIGVKRAQG